jgi:hypothetical protein
VANDDWRARFLKAATPPGGAAPKNTLEAMADIARRPWLEAKTLYGLFDEAYPEAKEGGRRAAPFVPYLMYEPEDFVLSLWFGGSASYGNGNFVFDAEGNLWSGTNWMAGSQSSVVKNIGGGVPPSRVASKTSDPRIFRFPVMIFLLAHVAGAASSR